jgi:hypothetical protein
MIRALLLCGTMAGLAACSTVPGSGPRTSAIEQGTAAYALVDLTPDIAAAVKQASRHPEPPIALPRGRPAGLIGPGDLLQIAFWEPNPAGTSG